MHIRRDSRFYVVIVEAAFALIGLPGIGWLLADRWQLGLALMLGYIILIGWLFDLFFPNAPLIGFPLTRNILAAFISATVLYLYLQRRYYG
ncbi:MAG: hypothetical protein DLM69_03045 [Candidatus Chloroheliales bacterium]|nr:MAG: hypothetical protein DLM69_03045 [Chloroflexota bacterium]